MHHNQAPGALNGRDDRRHVQRTDPPWVDDLDLDALRTERIGCLHRTVDHLLPGHYRHVASGTDGVGDTDRHQVLTIGNLALEGIEPLVLEVDDGVIGADGGKYNYPVHELTTAEIQGLYRAYARAAERALEAGFQWLEMHYAHGYLGASFFSPLSNFRADEYGGSVENRARFLIEALDAVREVWPERYPLTMRLGCDDHNPEGIQLDDAVTAIRAMKQHGLDLADISLGLNTDDIQKPPFNDVGFMVERAARIKREVGVPVATSWNLGAPHYADQLIREGTVDVVLLGRPALANPHWPVWAARELGHADPFSLLPQDWGWCLSNYRGHEPSIGWPAVVPTVRP